MLDAQFYSFLIFCLQSLVFFASYWYTRQEGDELHLLLHSQVQR